MEVAKAERLKIQVLDETGHPTKTHHVQFRTPRAAVGFFGEKVGAEFSVACDPGEYTIVLLDKSGRERDKQELTVKTDGEKTVLLRFR
jgi:hypothetical protein